MRWRYPKPKLTSETVMVIETEFRVEEEDVSFALPEGDQEIERSRWSGRPCPTAPAGRNRSSTAVGPPPSSTADDAAGIAIGPQTKAAETRVIPRSRFARFIACLPKVRNRRYTGGGAGAWTVKSITPRVVLIPEYTGENENSVKFTYFNTITEEMKKVK